MPSTPTAASSKTVLITDFDNTLYDWFHMWHSSFNAMLTEIERISGFNRIKLLPEIRSVHQRHGTSEYAFLIEELPSIRAKFDGQSITSVFDGAIHAYRSARKQSLKLYDGVKETLVALRERQVTIVLYTESLAFYTNDRVRRLGLDPLVNFIYSPPDHALPSNVTSHSQREEYRLGHAQHRYLKAGELKPNPAVLLDIVASIGRSRDECVYVGDSLMKDIAMAQDARIDDVYAIYGVVQHHSDYDLLRQVSHWPEGDVQREKDTRSITPTCTIKRFSDVLPLFEA